MPELRSSTTGEGSQRTINQGAAASYRAVGLRDAVAPHGALHELELVGRAVAGSVMSRPSRAEFIAGQAATAVPHDLSFAEFMEALNRSVAAVTALVNFTVTVSAHGRRSPDREDVVGSALMPLTAWSLHDRRHGVKGRGPALSENEQLLLKLYSNSHNQQLELPEWSWGAYPFVRMSARLAELPNAEGYLRTALERGAKIPEAAEQIAILDEKREQLQMARARSKPANGARSADGKPAAAAALNNDDVGAGLAKEIEAVEARLAELIQDRKEIDPGQIEGCCNEVSLTVTPRGDIIRPLLQLSSGLAKLIKAQQAAPEALSLELPELIMDQGVGRTARIIVSAKQFLEDPLSRDKQAEVLRLYMRVREALEAAVRSFGPAAYGEDKEISEFRSFGEKQLTGLFPLDPKSARELVAALVSHANPEIRNKSVQLTLQPVLQQQAGGTVVPIPYLAQPENLEALAGAVETVIRGDRAKAKQVQDACDQTIVREVIIFAQNIRRAIEERNAMSLAAVLDNAVTESRNQTEGAGAGGRGGSYVKQAGLILATRALAEDLQLARILKAMLRKREELSDLCRRFITLLPEGAKSSAGFIEQTRARIDQRLSHRFEDYWGHTKLKEEMAQVLTEHLQLVTARKDPQLAQTWWHLPLSDTAPNGHILDGPPGFGKTYLATCAAHEFNLPLIMITGEKMSQAMNAARSKVDKDGAGSSSLREVAGKRLEEELQRFINERIKETRELMQKTEEPSAILFFDEIEGWVLKRTDMKSSPEQIQLTNVTLTLFERAMKENPDILFLAATNHFDLLDEAGVRMGRFGFRHKVVPTTLDDAKDILSKAFDYSGIKLDTAAGNPDFERLAAEGIGMTPSTIKLAVFNCFALAAIAAKGAVPELGYDQLIERLKWIKSHTSNINGNGKGDTGAAK